MIPWLATLLGLGLAGCGNVVEITGSEGEATAEIADERVPAALRHLTGLAEEWTLDDLDRAERIDALSEAEKRAIIARVDPHLAEIDAWVDGFEPGAMPDEVSAFFWMRLAVEEMRY
jgi:hypothetical protein